MKTSIYSSVACNLDPHMLQAALPLFETEEIEGVEWAFDTLYKQRNIPDWFVALLQEIGEQGRLIGHGVYFSIFKGRWTTDQEAWLKHLRKVTLAFKFDHISEHFGFMTGADFHKGAPLHLPLNKATLAIGQDRLLRIQDACQLPVGLENLAFAYQLEDIQAQGQFLSKLLAKVNGFLILDLHNLYCQMHNFETPPEKVLQAYDLNLVREIHISGGSWEPSKIDMEKRIRRDTHDEAVPEEVFELLKMVIPQCPHLKFVVMEQLGAGLQTQNAQAQFRSDFKKMKEIIKSVSITRSMELANDFIPKSNALLSAPIEDQALQQQQSTLSNILEQSENFEIAFANLKASNLANSDWQIEQWEPGMLDTAIQIAQKWKRGFE